MVKMDVKIVGGPRRKIERQGVPGREKVGNPCPRVYRTAYTPMKSAALEIQLDTFCTEIKFYKLTSYLN